MKQKPEADQPAFLRSIAYAAVCAIAEYEDEVRVNCDVVNNHVVLSIHVAQSDVAIVLGTRGATADAIRRIIWTACKKTRYRCDIDVIAPPRR